MIQYAVYTESSASDALAWIFSILATGVLIAVFSRMLHYELFQRKFWSDPLIPIWIQWKRISAIREEIVTNCHSNGKKFITRHEFEQALSNAEIISVENNELYMDKLWELLREDEEEGEGEEQGGNRNSRGEPRLSLELLTTNASSKGFAWGLQLNLTGGKFKVPVDEQNDDKDNYDTALTVA